MPETKIGQFGARRFLQTRATLGNGTSITYRSEFPDYLCGAVRRLLVWKIETAFLASRLGRGERTEVRGCLYASGALKRTVPPLPVRSRRPILPHPILPVQRELTVADIAISVGCALSIQDDEANLSWTPATAMPPSPTAAAHRFTDPERTSPAAKIPGKLVSSGPG